MERLLKKPLILLLRENTRNRATCLHHQAFRTHVPSTTGTRQQPSARNFISHSQQNRRVRIPTTSSTSTKTCTNGKESGCLRIPPSAGQEPHRPVGLACSRRYSTAAAATLKHETPSYTRQQQPISLPSTVPITGGFRTASLDSSIVAQAPVELSTEQRFLLDQVINKKKSVFFTGSAGTGKSVLLRQLIEELKEVYKPGQVAVTASTGIAACNIGGCTLHSFAGIRLGTGTVDQLMEILSGNRVARGRWKKVKVLIIDEISMIDGDLFDKLEEIARKIKMSNKPFGGIQLIITGDFFQLPPVASGSFTLPTSTPSLSATSLLPRRTGSRSTTTIIKRDSAESSKFDDNPFSDNYAFSDDHLSSSNTAPPLLDMNEAASPAIQQPTFCFDAKTWGLCIERTLQLTEVFRQRDPAFIKMLTEMRHGKLSEETCQTFKQLERAPQYPNDGIVATELFALRRQVDEANHRHLASLPGAMYVYESQDSGPLKEFMDKACTASSKLQLKENAQVMLIKNLTPNLVNGSMGLVVGFQEDMSFDDETHQWETSRFPVVRFQNEEDDLVIKPDEWKMELPNGEIMASRIQLPLILAWAMSIHKSQGQTMQRLKVDMGKIFEAGQAYVALSRGTSLAGLQVLNFNKRSVQAHERVAEFYDGLLTVQDLMEQQQRAVAKKSVRARKRAVKV